jgi:hypothetical protein
MTYFFDLGQGASIGVVVRWWGDVGRSVGGVT